MWEDPLQSSLCFRYVYEHAMRSESQYKEEGRTTRSFKGCRGIKALVIARQRVLLIRILRLI